MNYKISGGNLQLVTIQLGQNEKIYAEAGTMVYMSGNINMEAKMRGGFLKGIGRKFMGETMFLTEFTTAGGEGMVSFGGAVPGTIKALEVNAENQWMVQKDAFLVAEDKVELNIGFQKRLGTAFFGGEGFILQKLSGQGTVFIHACGDFVEFDLQPEQLLKVDTGSVVGWEHTIDFDIQRVKGIKTMFFGGEGLFLTTLRGPGKVILQSMNLANLASALSPFLPRHNTSGSNSGVVGTLVKESLGR
ncbi:MAG: TIGR00266 family protein [Candidatus Thermoplasmatota archaeon]|nr:TIGR00266 family protein [Candidatus Thermoplasmatota archaeon]